MSVGTLRFLCLLALFPATLAGQEAVDTTSAADGAGSMSLGDASWLAGCWEASSPDGGRSVEEQWMAPRGGLMLGLSRSVRDGEARGHEFLAIRETEGRLVYHAAPSGQSPTDFTARAVEEGRLEFVNAAHDFPRKIAYRRVGADSVRAEVFGEVDDDVPSFALAFGRVSCPGR